MLNDPTNVQADGIKCNTSTRSTRRNGRAGTQGQTTSNSAKMLSRATQCVHLCAVYNLIPEQGAEDLAGSDVLVTSPPQCYMIQLM